MSYVSIQWEKTDTQPDLHLRIMLRNIARSKSSNLEKRIQDNILPNKKAQYKQHKHSQANKLPQNKQEKEQN